MPKVYREYKDLDLDFTPHPITGDINILKGPDAVRRSLKNIILTNLFEKPFNRSFGSRVSHLLFENVDPLTKYVLRDEILSAIQINEPRVNVLDVQIDFNFDENRYEVSLLFNIENLSDNFTVDIFLERVR